MTEPQSQPPRTHAPNNLPIVVALCAVAVVLAAILFMLVFISLNGLDIRVHGDIDFAQLADGDQITVHLTADEPFTLTMPQPVPLEATGPDGEAIPATLSLATCPVCGGPMLPSKWNPWTGRIVWSCPACGETVSQPVSP